MVQQLGARKEADWLVLNTHDAMNAVAERVGDFGGFVYNLPFH
jgi:hypothetical protein